MEENENNQNNNQYYQANPEQQQTYYQAQGTPQPSVHRQQHPGNAVVALVLGVLSLFAATTGIGAIVGIILAIIGILQGNWARRSNMNDGMALAGLILSVVGLVICAIGFIFGIAIFGLTCSFLREVFSILRYSMYW